MTGKWFDDLFGILLLITIAVVIIMSFAMLVVLLSW